jgi:sulfate adenylyltransferase large subunit
MLYAPDIRLAEGLEGFLERDLKKELLRFTTAGSVDDGKSTLIGRLLHDSKTLYEDQLTSVKKSRFSRSGGPIDFSLLTDGLRAEREQGITIDVAYRYFSTSQRRFIIADTPGHEQYTRNMVTGACTSDLAVVLVDATQGLLPQTRRHVYMASLLGISDVFAAINKMDLVGYRGEVFFDLQKDFCALAKRLGIPAVQCIPISALEGDNVVTRSHRTPWYSGPALLELLETVEIHPVAVHKMQDFRFPVQSVIRPDRSFRGFAGRISSGIIRPGDRVLALPSRQETRVQAIVTFDGELDEAFPSQSVVLKLDDEIDLSRGDMLVAPNAPPQVSSHFAATVVWLYAKPLKLNRVYLAKHAGRYIKPKAVKIRFRVDVNALTEQPAGELEMNGIALVEFETNSPLYFDPYESNRTTGSFILIDPISNATIGAAMIREDLEETAVMFGKETARIERWQHGAISSEERYERHGHRAAILSVVGDRISAEGLERALFEKGFETALLDSNEVPRAALPALLSALWSSGFVIVYWSETAPSEVRALLRAVANDFIFEFSTSQGGRANEMIDRALEIASRLRATHDARDPAKADRNGPTLRFGKYWGSL